MLAHLDEVQKLHEKYNLVVQSYGPLSPIIRHPTGGPLKPVLERIAQRLAKDSGKEVDETAVLLLWTMGKGAVALTSSSKEERIRDIANVEGLPDLTKEEIYEIDSVGRKVHYRAYVSFVLGG